MRKEELELIKYRIDKAYKTLEAAEKLYTEKYYNSSINRAYYACFYAVNAILFLNNLSSSKHSGIINLFNLHFIKTNIIEKKYGKFYSDLFRQRQ